MNAKRRKELGSISADMSELMDDLQSNLSELRDRLEEAIEEIESVAV